MNKRTLIQHIKQLPAYRETTFSDADDPDESYLTYHAIDLFGGVIVQEEYSSPHTTETTYYVYAPATDRFREATPREDDYLRHGDLYETPFRELEGIQYIISKAPKKKKEGD